MKCPHCGGDIPEAIERLRASAKDQVEALEVTDEMIAWCRTLPVGASFGYASVAAELDHFKDRMRANGYRTNAGPVKDAKAAFRTHMRNAVKFSAGRTGGAVRPVARKPERKLE